MALRGDEPDLALGDSGDRVSELQDRLRALGLRDRYPDGTFDAATENAVRQFQGDVGHDNDGQVTQPTWQALDDRLVQYGLQYDANSGVGNQHWDQAVVTGGSDTTITDGDPYRHWDGQRWLHWNGAEWVPEAGGAQQLAADPAGSPAGAGAFPGQAAGAETCSCVEEQEIVAGEAGEPGELDGVIEEGEAEDPQELQVHSGRHPGRSSSVPSSCRATSKACFSISRGRAWLLRPGRVLVVAVPALGGRPGHETPTGHFSVIFHDPTHVSSTYHAPMPYYVNFTTEVGFHAGSLSVKSHGCVHLSHDNARRFYDYLQDGDHVDVIP